MKKNLVSSLFLILLIMTIAQADSNISNIPHLQKMGSSTELMVHNKPFLILGGELNNSSSSSLVYVAPIFQQLAESHLNTVLTPIAWDLIEPKENQFDFHLFDGLIDLARKDNLHLVLLWLASWKNGMSSYQPSWVKRQYKRFPLVRDGEGHPRAILSAFAKSNYEADANAFAHLMAHLKAVDEKQQTVVMIQVENEVGILNDSRDRSPLANAAFAKPVPEALINRLKSGTVPELNAIWVKSGSKTQGDWSEVFGSGPTTDEIFMAWHYARYLDHVAATGKKEYPIPMYANAWLDGDGAKPGNYPSGCPEAHLLDVWQVGAPNLNLLAPDLYASNFQERCELYTRQGNTLFIPEMNSREGGAENMFYAIGTKNALGTSPFGIDRMTPDSPVAKSYALLSQIARQILEHRGQDQVIGFVLDQQHPQVEKIMGGCKVEISLDEIFGHTAQQGHGIVIATGDGHFLGAGQGFRVLFQPLHTPGERIGINLVQEGKFEDGKWVGGRYLNGDETDQGRSWRFAFWAPSISKCSVYRFK